MPFHGLAPGTLADASQILVLNLLEGSTLHDTSPMEKHWTTTVKIAQTLAAHVWLVSIHTYSTAFNPNPPAFSSKQVLDVDGLFPGCSPDKKGTGHWVLKKT